MLTEVAAVSFAPMAQREPIEKTSQINFRMKDRTIARMMQYRSDNPLHPTLTMIVEAAVNDWLDRIGNTATAKPAKAAKPPRR